MRTDDKGHDICGLCESTSDDFSEDPNVIILDEVTDTLSNDVWIAEENEHG